MGNSAGHSSSDTGCSAHDSDITAKSQTARLLVTVQMITDLIVLGLAIKVIVAAVRRGQEHRAAVPSALRTGGDGR
ncbi:hypothetical protein [Streptomyces sp. NPDC004788]